jgi:CHAD domain-containing protein
MSFALASDEPVLDGLRRCAREQLQTAVGHLAEGLTSEPVTAIHEARKALKKERSLLRLARGTLAHRQRRRINRALRVDAHQLGRARDADALLGAMTAINERFSGQIPEATMMAIEERLREERYAARTHLIEAEVPSRVADALGDILADVDDWRFRGGSWSHIRVGLGREYARGHRALRRAAKSPTPERMHDWRKRSKDLWYHLRLLEPLAPGTVHGQAKDAHRLADVLGDLHDLAVLEAAIPRLAEGVVADTGALLAVIEHRREQLAGEALSVGERVYAEPTKAFLRRLHAYWRAWRTEARAAAQEQPAALAAATRQPI